MIIMEEGISKEGSLWGFVLFFLALISLAYLKL